MMKVLTLTQPWATLVAIGAKRIETRSWSTSYRGPLAIHAGKRLGPGGERGLQRGCGQRYFYTALEPILRPEGRWLFAADTLSRGAVVAVCELADVVRSETLTFEGQWSRLREGGIQTWTLTDQERAFGDYTAGRFAWLLINIRMLPAPIPAKGQLGLWEWQPPEGFEHGH